MLAGSSSRAHSAEATSALLTSPFSGDAPAGSTSPSPVPGASLSWPTRRIVQSRSRSRR
jgi:hypothetical protein